MFSPEIFAMIQRPNTASKKNSAELNFNASFASCGLMSHKQRTLTTPPT